MQRYVPPHMRQRGGASSSSARASPRPPNTQDPSSSTRYVDLSPPPLPLSTAPQRFAQDTAPLPLFSHRSYSPRPTTPSRSALASPASDIRPMRPSSGGRTAMDEMEMIQSVSRSGGDGAEGDALKDHGMQERYRRYIDERLDKHYTIFKSPRETPPAAEATEELESLSSIVLLFRKLREGVVASNRIDAFAIEVFESSACLSLLARNHTQLLSSLSGLVPGLYQAYDELHPELRPELHPELHLSSKGKSKDDTPRRGIDVDTLADSVSGLRLGDRRAQFASILLLYHLAHTGSTATFHSVLQDLTAPTSQRLRRPFADVLNNPPSVLGSSGSSVTAFLRREDLRYPIRAAQALAQETFSPIRFFRLVRDERVSPYERAMLSWAADRVRERAWEVMRRAYIEIGMEWAMGSLGLTGAAVGPWVEQRGGRVEVGKLKLR